MKKRAITKMKKEKDNEKAGDILLVKKIDKNIVLPEYILKSDVGLDLRANESVSLGPFEEKAVRTGLVIKIPDGHVGLIRDRAGIVHNMNIHTAAGTFDPAYRGEVSVILVNMGEEAVEIEKGMRIAQLLVLPVTRVQVKESKDLSVTERGDKGFGSTGLSEKQKIKELNNLVKEIQRKSEKEDKKQAQAKKEQEDKKQSQLTYIE